MAAMTVAVGTNIIHNICLKFFSDFKAIQFGWICLKIETILFVFTKFTQ
jgi:hypothetical protein